MGINSKRLAQLFEDGDVCAASTQSDDLALFVGLVMRAVARAVFVLFVVFLVANSFVDFVNFVVYLVLDALEVVLAHKTQ